MNTMLQVALAATLVVGLEQVTLAQPSTVTPATGITDPAAAAAEIQGHNSLTLNGAVGRQLL